MSAESARPHRFDRTRHDTADFECGNEPRNRWLKRNAGQSDRSDAARTFVIADPKGLVLGYYALVAGQLRHEDATPAVRKGQSRNFPIPVALLARLAVHVNHQGQGLGAALLRDALARVQAASAEVAIRAVVVHAIDEQAGAFYERFGFRALVDSRATLMVTLSELGSAGF